MSPLALSIRFLQTQPDGRLIDLARAGHERAFEALVQRYRRPLLKYCRRLSYSEASAEDVLQQALMQAWLALSTSDARIRDARAWLYRIVHNVAISHLRRPVHDPLDALADGMLSGEEELERRLEVRAALASLAALPELQREVMLSTAVDGRSHDEVAAALGLSHGAVRGLIYRARATLRAAAAVVVPSPMVQWAARQGAGAGRSAAMVEALAGGGSVGLGSLLVKGGAVVAAAGAIATAAGVTSHSSHHRRITAGDRLSLQARAAGGAQHAAGGPAAAPAATQVASVQPVATARGSASGSPGRSGAHRGGGPQVLAGARTDHLRAAEGNGSGRRGSSSGGSGSGRHSDSKPTGSGIGGLPGRSDGGSGGSGGQDSGSGSGSGSGGGSGSGDGSGSHDGASAMTTSAQVLTIGTSDQSGGSGSGGSVSGSGGGSGSGDGSGSGSGGSSSGSGDGGSSSGSGDGSGGGLTTSGD